MSYKREKMERLANKVEEKMRGQYGEITLVFVENPSLQWVWHAVDDQYLNCKYFLVYYGTGAIERAWRNQDEAIQGLTEILQEKDTLIK